MNKTFRFVFLFVLLTVVFYQTAQSQIIVNNNGVLQVFNNGAIQNGGSDNNLIQAPRETIQRLKTAQALMAEKRYSESVRILWDILKTEEDSFIRVNYDKTVVEETTENSAEKPDEKSDPNKLPTNQTPSAAGPVSLISLKTYIQNILSQAPEEARQASELIVGTEAQNAFDEAVQSGSLDRLLSVRRDYFNTEAGYKASFLSGLILLNDGQASSAASIFDSLADVPGVRQKYEPAFSVLWLNSIILSGQDVLRRELVTQLRQRLARVDWTVEDKQMTGFDNLEQIEKYIAVFSSKTQISNCRFPSAEPFTLPRWTVPTYTNPTVEALIQTVVDNETKSASSFSNRYNALMCVFEPVVSNQRVFLRTLFGLTAVDLQTGKRLWDSSADFSSEIQRRWDSYGEYERKAISQFLYSVVAFRSKYDFTYGALRADEKYVYAIEDIWKERIQQGVLTPSTTSGIVLSRTNSASSSRNRLAAYDMNTGKLKWHVGSATVVYGSGSDNSLDSTTFLGAPLVMNGKLYILGETSDSGVVFYELDSDTGKVLWSQTLGESSNSLSDRTYNLTPAYQNGMLVCPLSGSALVCIDLRQRRLLWGFNTPSPQNRRSGFFISGNSDIKYELGRMNDAYNNSSFQKGYQLFLLGNKAFYTPIRSSDTYVINLADGSLDEHLSSLKSQNGYIPLIVEQKEIVFMTPTDIRICDIEKYSQNQPEYNRVQALKREKEREIATTPAEGRQKIVEEYSKLASQFAQLEEQRKNTMTIIPFPDSARLIGRAFEFGGSCFIPLDNNTLAEFNLSKREFVQSLKSFQNKSFGTVCLLSDKVFSQNFDRLDCYDVKQFVENQIQNKTSAPFRTFLASGYIAWANDDIESAAKHFRSAADIAPKSCLPLLKALAVYALKKDYQRYEPLLDILQPAFDSEQDRMIIAQFKIESCLLQNDIQKSLDMLEPVMDDALKSNLKSCTIDLINDNMSIERNVWVGSILEKIYSASSDEQKRTVEQWVEKRLDAPKEKRTVEWLTRQLDFFRVLPVAAELRKELFQAYSSSNSLVQAELVLRQQRMNADAKPEQIAAAWAEQALLLQKNAPVDSAKIFKLINRIYPDVPCCQDKTADEYVKSLGESSPVYKEYSFNLQWPQNEVQINIVKSTRPPVSSGSDSKKLFLNENVFLDGQVMRRSSSSQQNLILYDRFGQNVMLLSPEKVPQQGRIIYQRSELNTEAPWYAAEHLLFLSDKNGQMSAINFLVNPSILWSKDYEQEKLGDEDQNPYILIRKANQPEVRFTEVNKLCSVYGNIVFAQMEDGSYAGLDAATGRMRWRRMFEKKEQIILVDNDSFYTVKNSRQLDNQGNVFSAASEVLGERYSIYTGFHEASIRIPSSRLAVTPKGFVFVESITDSNTQKQTYRMIHCSAREQKVLWKLDSDFNSSTVYLKPLNLLCRSNGSNGRVQLIDCDTGKALVDDVFEIMTQAERDKVVEDAIELKKRIDEENKRIEEEEKNDPKKRDERIRRQSREGRMEDQLPENYSENLLKGTAKNFFDGVDVYSDANSDGDFYMIIRSAFGYTRKQRLGCKQFSPMRGLHLPKAKIYKFSRDGKPLWKEPLFVSDQYFYFDQPTGSPFLVFGCNRQIRENNTSRSDFEFLFVDKATGRVWKYQGKNPIGAFQTICNPEKQEFSIFINNKETLVLTFSDVPLKSDAPKEMQLLTEEEKAKLEAEKAKQEKEKEQLEKEKEAAGEDDPFA